MNDSTGLPEPEIPNEDVIHFGPNGRECRYMGVWSDYMKCKHWYADMSHHQVVVPWQRLDSGIFHSKEGDIHAAYCADKLTSNDIKTGKQEYSIGYTKVITIEGRLAACTGTCNSYSYLYELVPVEQFVSPGEQIVSSVNNCCGIRIKYKKDHFVMDFPFMATPSKISFEESLDRLRRMYAYGGHFAMTQSYSNYLMNVADVNEVARWERMQNHAMRGLKQIELRCLYESDRLPHRDNDRTQHQPQQKELFANEF